MSFVILFSLSTAFNDVVIFRSGHDAFTFVCFKRYGDAPGIALQQQTLTFASNKFI